MGGGGGGKTTKITYTYALEWISQYVDSTSFSTSSSAQDKKQTACGNYQNPVWPAGVPESATKYANDVKAGTYSLSTWYIQQVPINTPLSPSTPPPAGWTKSGNTYSKPSANL